MLLNSSLRNIKNSESRNQEENSPVYEESQGRTSLNLCQLALFESLQKTENLTSNNLWTSLKQTWLIDTAVKVEIMLFVHLAVKAAFKTLRLKL